MKGRPEQSFLDTFSERFMNHVRQVNRNNKSKFLINSLINSLITGVHICKIYSWLQMSPP